MRKIFFVSIIICLSLLIGCSTNEDEAIRHSIGMHRGHEIWFHLDPSQESFDENGGISLETPQEPIFIQLANPTFSEKTVMLKIFYNYEEIPFRIGNDSEYQRQKIFVLDPGYLIEIPIRMYHGIKANDYHNILTIGVFASPEHHSKNDDSSTIGSNFAQVLNFVVHYGGDLQLDLTYFQQDSPEQLSDILSRGIRVNQDSKELMITYGTGGVFTMWPNPLRVLPGEMVEFSFFANPYTHDFLEVLNDYLIISMIGWEQVHMNGLPFLYFEARPHDMRNDVSDFGTFTIRMPDELGFHEFVVFIVPNPTQKSDGEFRINPEVGFPFTIEVRE